MVGEPEASEISEMALDAFKEVCNTVAGNMNTSLSGIVGKSVSISDLQLHQAQSEADALRDHLGGGNFFGLVPFTIQVADNPEAQCWEVFSEDLLKTLHKIVAPPPDPTPAPKPETQATAGVPQAAPVQFESLTQEGAPTSAPPNLDLIMDIGLDIRVELGRTNMKIRDVLNLGGGSVVELDKLAGEPVDLLVNDVIFAKGEVVVIDENFGVRITDILTLQERIKTLGDMRD